MPRDAQCLVHRNGGHIIHRKSDAELFPEPSRNAQGISGRTGWIDRGELLGQGRYFEGVGGL
jgi:hypothetical protein